MKHLIILPAILAACAPEINCQRVWQDPVTGLWGCGRPTATVQALTDRRGEAKPAPKADKPKTDDKIVDDSGMFDGKEPARGDYDNERDYRDAHDSWKEGRG